MSFGKNLKKARMNNDYSQEQLAEILSVSRQAISRWESDMGYPEVDMLLKLRDTLNVSLDWLFDIDVNETASKKIVITSENGKITIHSPTENVIVNCSRVMTSSQFKAKGQPQYALFAATDSTSPLGGENRVILGWYADENAVKEELNNINDAIRAGVKNYTLQFAVRTKKQGLKILIEP